MTKRNRFVLAGWSILIGFAGSVTGLVYGFPPLLDRIWWAVWFCLACVFAAWGLFHWSRMWSRSPDIPAISRTLRGSDEEDLASSSTANPGTGSATQNAETS